MKPRTIRLPEDLDRLLQDEAKQTGTTEAEIIRRVLCDYYHIREGETSIEDLVRRVVGEVLAESTSRAPVSTSRSTHKAPQSTSERAPPRTLEAPLGAPSEHLRAPADSTSEAPQSTDDVLEALKAIKSHLDQGQEPTADEIAQEVGMDKRPLGRLMKSAGVQAKNTTRGGVTARYYTLDLLQQIEKLLTGK